MDDSDDSAFLFLPTSLKRRASKENNEKTKQLRLSNEDKQNNLNDGDGSLSPICIQISSGSSTESKEKENHEEKAELLETMNEAKKKITMTCPLCLKIFDNTNLHLSHMKQCAKKKKMTTQQLLSALELQKKQMEERRALGLSSQVPVSEVKKNNNKKKVQDVDPESNFQLALALAMSKSLEDQGSSNSCGSETNSDCVIEAQKATLEKFGFTSSSSTGVQSFGRKKFKSNRKSVLKERTKEDRDRIISEKASEILLEDDNVEVPQRKENEQFEVSGELLKYQEAGSRLWKGSEDEQVPSYYVENIKDKLDILPGSQKSSQNVSSGGSSVPTSEDIQNQISKLNQPNTALSESWKKMINNKELSDISVRTKDDKIVCLHSIVLHVRLPNAKNIEQVFKNYNFTTIINFLEFLYSGILNKDMKRTDVENLFSLAQCASFKNLVDVLNILKEDLKINSESSDGIIPSSLSPLPKPDSPEVAIISKEPSIEKDWPMDGKGQKDWPMDDMVDLTQSSHDSFPGENPNENNSDESDLDNFNWGFREQEKKRKELEELEKQEEEKENLINSNELFKIEAIMKKQKELSQELMNDDEDNYKNKLEREKIYGLQLESNNEEKDIFEDFDKNSEMKKEIDVKNEECIVLSSDSNASFDEENTERLFKKSKPVVDLDYEIPPFDPYDHFDNDLIFNMTPLGARDKIQSQSLLSGGFSPVSSRPKSLRRSLENTPQENFSQKEIVKETPKGFENPDFFSTPISDKRTRASLKKNSTGKKPAKRKSDASKKILRNSVRLSLRSRILKTNKKRTVRKSASNRQKKLEESAKVAEMLTRSILNEFNNHSLGPGSSTPKKTPVTKRKYLEVTPVANPGVEYTEKVTPMPDYSDMEATVLKQHLGKYGLKRSLAKSKAKKILKHIYEELHPIFNTETGKIVKYLPEEEPKSKPKPARKRTKNNDKKATPQKSPKIVLETPEKSPRKILETPEKIPKKILETPEKITDSDASMNKSTDYDSDGSEYDYSKEQLTQSSSGNKIDLPTAFNEYLQNNQEYHRKILLYEPIWIEELQNLLLINCNKKFKLSDLMDFLDKQCITFRSEAQKKNNQRRNDKKKTSPKKKSPRKPTKSQSSSSLSIS